MRSLLRNEHGQLCVGEVVAIAECCAPETGEPVRFLAVQDELHRCLATHHGSLSGGTGPRRRGYEAPSDGCPYDWPPAATRRNRLEPQPGWDSAVGLRIEELSATKVVGYIDIDERHHQGYGIVHGGVWASVVESIGSHGAAMAAREITGELAVVGVANSTDFLRPHRTGRVRATGRRFRRAGRNRSGSSRSSARATGRWWPGGSCGSRTCPPCPNAETELRASVAARRAETE